MVPRRGAALIPKESKRLVEVGFAVAMVSNHPVGESSLRHRDSPTVHLWSGGRAGG